MNHTQFAVHHFSDLERAPFSIRDYSQLKFGDNEVARKFGYQLANAFAEEFLPTIIGNKLLVIPSPYNYVKNAATIMTEHFIDCLNMISVNNNGEHVEASIIHRKCSYTKDYGHLSKEHRKGLLDGDSFYINEEFLKDKTILFLDDVIITGTHEDKIKELLYKKNIDNECFFLYFAQYHGINPEIEAEINFAAIKEFDDYKRFVKTYNPKMIIRPLKYILSRSGSEVLEFLKELSRDKVEEIYYGCLAEGYYKLPEYQTNFAYIQNEFGKRFR